MLNYTYLTSPKRWGRPEFNASFSIGFGNGLDPDVSGLYPLNEEREAKYQDSILFISEPSGTFFI